MRTSDLIVTCVEIIFFIFHFSLLIVLIYERKSKFSGAFFNMLRMLFISDITFFINSFGSRIPAYGFFSDYFKNDVIIAKLQIHSVAYLLGFQFLIHSFIPFNRFTLFWFPFSYKKIWEKQWYIAVILVIPLLMQIPWILEPAIFYYSVILTFVNPKAATSSSYLIFVFSCLMTLFAAIFNLLAVIKHFIHKYKSPNLIQLKEITFLYVSCFLFIFHCFYCFSIIGKTLFSDNPLVAYLFQALSVIIIDIIAWSGSISLLIISKYVRKAYFNFYRNMFGQKKPVGNLVSHKVSTISRSPMTPMTQIT